MRMMISWGVLRIKGVDTCENSGIVALHAENSSLAKLLEAAKHKL
jgi:hypothetical protein